MRWRKVSKCCCASTVVGASTATCLPSMTALNAARIATSVLPKPTSPQIADPSNAACSMSFLVAAMALSWSGVSRNGNECSNSLCHFVSGPNAWPGCVSRSACTREHFARVIEDRGGGVFLRPRPFRIGERTERRRFLADADITRNQIGLLERDVELRVIGEFKGEHFLHSSAWRAARVVSPRNRPTPCSRCTTRSPSLSSLKSIWARLRPSLFRALQTPPPMSRKAPKQFRRRKERQVAGRKTEAACKRSFGQLDSGQR